MLYEVITIPGKEYCDQDVNSYNIIMPMKRAIARGVETSVSTFEELYALFVEELV